MSASPTSDPATTSDQVPAVVMHNVDFTYRKRRRRVEVLRQFSLRLKQGEVVAVVGESGSGKSSILSLLAGLALPDNGEIRVLGAELGQMSAVERASFRLRHIASVHQDFHLLPELPAVENVAFVLRLKGTSRDDSLAQAKAALESVGMGHRLGHIPRELSGGEQQRVAVARAVVSRPKLLLADEPTGSLDADRRDEILDLVLTACQGATIVLVTHDLAVASRAGRVVHLR